MRRVPVESYRGNDPFLFVSYAHKDADQVYSEIQWLHERGYRLWYDEGIDPATIFTAEIVKALSGACLVLAFLSPNAVASEWVEREIHVAVSSLKKPVVGVYLSETTLSEALLLLLAGVQTVPSFRMERPNYWRVLERALPDDCRSGSRSEQRVAHADPYRAGLRLQAEGQHIRAVQSLSWAIEADSSKPSSYEKRAYSLLQMERFDEALRDCTESIRLAPDSAQSYHIRALAHLGLGQFRACRADFDKAHALDPTLNIPPFVKSVRFRLLSLIDWFPLRLRLAK
jgi:tetratricopeptide (TPR) repeat protein